ncbi:TetR/AcrR family transcriptional regulator [Anaerosolibacter sp.]|uniref:TetR/AcrR family transcriptional regulator n=1 Tax=Anaerosolibacter sp. TaxID=1872527 RepID=UPI0039EF432A
MDQEKEKSFERRQYLIDAAIKEFSQKGYESASLNNILKEAQISKGTFYYHFKNKEELYFYLIELLIQEKKSFLGQVMKPEDFQQDIFTILKLQAKLGIEFAGNNPEINDFAESFAKEKGSAIYEKALKKYNFHENDPMKLLIDRAYTRGDLRTDLPKEFVQRLIGYLFTHMAEITNAVKVQEYEGDLNYLIDFMCDGLRAKE